MIRQSDSAQMKIRIEARRHGFREAPHEIGFVAPMGDVAANIRGFFLVPNDKVLRALKQRGSRKRRLGFLMFEFSVNDGGDARARISLDIFPDVQNGSAGRIDHNATLLRKQVDVRRGYAESGNQDDIVPKNIVILVRPVRKAPYSHPFQLIIDVRIVDDFAGEKNAMIRELCDRFVRVFDSALDPVAEAEFHGEPEGEIPRLEAEAIGAHNVHDLAAIILAQLRPDLRA